MCITSGALSELPVRVLMDYYFGTYRDDNGEISFDELKQVFSENVGADAIPFNFDW
jgi:hypothetical protein